MLLSVQPISKQKIQLFLLCLASSLLTACDIPNADISGKITYDNVSHNETTDGLEYTKLQQSPIRGVRVEAIENGKVITSDITDDQGNYKIVVKMDKFITLRVRSEFALGAENVLGATKIVDNTNQQAVYVLESNEFEVKREQLTRNLNASSGWNGTEYVGTRAAAPFHILDRIYDIHAKLSTIDQTINMPELMINWSVNNVAESGDRETGQIGTSFYQNGEIFLLGAADADTDEYDGHVIIHEWGHFFEDTLSRSDSIGGPHAGGDRLDPRVAFGEGFGNAWSAIITDDPFYRDSFGARQESGFSINVEANDTINPGWYSEGSVQSILYDLYDDFTDDADTFSLGLEPIYNVLIGAQKDSEAFTSIFTFMTYILENNPAESANFEALLKAQNISPAIDIWGSKAANDANEPNSLPVYIELNPTDRQNICTSAAFGTTGNKLANHRFIKLNIPSSGNYSLTVTPNSRHDVDAYLYQHGELLALNEDAGIEPLTLSFDAQEGVLVADTLAYDEAGSAISAACYDVALTQN
ncbi:MAG: hypothetical protein HWD86_09995 [Kangiellaceae bacterium]|nr:hypothetical protein [Kangiellaceae bacterium]